MSKEFPRNCWSCDRNPCKCDRKTIRAKRRKYRDAAIREQHLELAAPEIRWCKECGLPVGEQDHWREPHYGHNGLCCDCFDVSCGAPHPWLFWPLSPAKRARRRLHKKDTKRWCRGVVGRAHKPEWRLWKYRSLGLMRNWRELTCTVCERKLMTSRNPAEWKDPRWPR